MKAPFWGTFLLAKTTLEIVIPPSQSFPYFSLPVLVADFAFPFSRFDDTLLNGDLSPLSQWCNSERVCPLV